MSNRPSGAPEPALRLRQARGDDAAALARLMTGAITWGRLAELGPRLLTLLHRHMAASRRSICVVAEDDGGIVGYLTVVTDAGGFYREFLWRHGFAAALAVLPRLWLPARWRVLWRGLSHFPSAPRDDPRAEAISFAVRPGSAGRGVGKALFRAAVAEAGARGVPTIKFATVEATNDVANAFYRKLGCRLVRSEAFYRDSRVNVYFYDVERSS